VPCVCEWCGKAFAVKTSKAKRGEKTFCTNACRAACYRAPRHRRTCGCCGGSFVILNWQASKGEGQFCSTECRDLGAHIARRDPPGIRLTSRYYGWSWREAQQAARERDGRCVDCGITSDEIGRALAVHHIVPFKRYGIRRHREANALTNLVALCQPCHIRREWATNWRD